MKNRIDLQDLFKKIDIAANTSELQPLLDEINILTQKLSNLQPVSPETQRRLEKKFRLEFNYNSNHIEGNTMTYGETELLLFFDDTNGNHTLREYEEMKAHDVVYQLVSNWAKDKERPPLTEWDIKYLNEILLVRPFWKDAITPTGQPTRKLIKTGDYKDQPNSVRLSNGEIFEYASPMETPILMGELLQWYRNAIEYSTLHAVALAALFHYKFVRIHPFDDGNGRGARLLMNYVLFCNNFPLVIIKSADKRNYLSALNNADTGNIIPFIEYIATQLIWSLELSIKAAKGESIEEPDDLDKEITLLKKELGKANVLEQAATVENIAQIIEDNIIPLFVLVEEKCEGLKEFFFDFDKEVLYNGSSGVGMKESKWPILIENWLHNSIKRNNTKIHNITYQYGLKGFKKSISAPNFWLGIRIYFDDFNYRIDSNNHKSLIFPYDKKLPIETLKSIASPLIKELIEDIKRAGTNGK